MVFCCYMAEGNKGGRPSIYTQELADRLCSGLSEGKSLRTVCLADDMPDKSTVFMWMRTKPEFLDQYTRAKEESADAMADEVIDISDTTSNDIIEDENGRPIVNSARIQRDRLRVETRKWLMAKMKPKKYGDKLDLTSAGDKLPAPIFGGTAAKTDEEE